LQNIIIFIKTIQCLSYVLFEIIELSYVYGKNQVKKRLWGFKANFFAAIADAIATEGWLVIL
jgi:hypothetical protein